MEVTANPNNIKQIALITLVVQNTTLVLLMKMSRQVEGGMYLATTAVVMQEVMKLFVCLFILWRERGFDVPATLQFLKEEILDKPGETMKLGVPAGLYTIQNNLLFGAIDNLDAATFQVTYQMKILTTAVFSVLMLGKALSPMKWLSLVILVLGVALVQINPDAQEDPSKAAQRNTMTGLICVTLACLSSGFAGVYFEKILKGSGSNIWLRNVQLGAFGFVLGMVAVWQQDAEKVAEGGFFQGYSLLVWTVITVNAAGGLLIAVVVKYADNILKGFATSVAIILSSVLSIFLFDFVPSFYFLLGASLVIGAVAMYSKPDPQPPVLPIAK